MRFTQQIPENTKNCKLLKKILFEAQLHNILFHEKKLKKNFMASFYGWGSTASRLEPLREGSLLFTTKFPEIPGTHFIDLERMKGWVDLGATQWFWTRDLWIGKPAPYLLGHCSIKDKKTCHVLKIFNFLYILKHSVSFKYILNCIPSGHETWPTNRYSHGQYFWENLYMNLRTRSSI